MNAFTGLLIAYLLWILLLMIFGAIYKWIYELNHGKYSHCSLLLSDTVSHDLLQALAHILVGLGVPPHKDSGANWKGDDTWFLCERGSTVYHLKHAAREIWGALAVRPYYFIVNRHWLSLDQRREFERRRSARG